MVNGRPSVEVRHMSRDPSVWDGVDGVDRPSGWQRLGPFGQFLVGAVIVTAIGFGGVMALENVFALTVKVPTVDALPDRVSICGRTYRRAVDASQDLLTLDGLRATGTEPIIVLPLRMQPCTGAACNGCTTGVFVRVEGDRYAEYELLGGP
jgi:hypothetical protein